MKRTLLILAAATLFCGAAYAGPNDAHPYTATANKSPPKNINHNLNRNNPAPMYKATAKPEPVQRITHSHHLKHHHAV